MILEKIQIILNDKKLNNTKLGEASGIPQGTISKIMTGRQISIPNELYRYLFWDLKVNPLWFYDNLNSEASLYWDGLNESKDFLKLKDQYSEILEELNNYQKKEIESLKNSNDVHL